MVLCHKLFNKSLMLFFLDFMMSGILPHVSDDLMKFSMFPF